MHFWIQKLHRNHVWGRWICFWCSDVARIVVYWFGLHRGCVTSTWPKLRSTSQNYLPCLIWSQSVHWGPFYSTACPKNRTLLSPFINFREKGKWSSEGGASFGFSFALVVIAAGVYLMDIGIIYIATRDPYRTKKVGINKLQYTV